jgi:hypothetical protein
VAEVLWEEELPICGPCEYKEVACLLLPVCLALGGWGLGRGIDLQKVWYARECDATRRTQTHEEGTGAGSSRVVKRGHRGDAQVTGWGGRRMPTRDRDNTATRVCTHARTHAHTQTGTHAHARTFTATTLPLLKVSTAW